MAAKQMVQALELLIASVQGHSESSPSKAETIRVPAQDLASITLNASNLIGSGQFGSGMWACVTFVLTAFPIVYLAEMQRRKIAIKKLDHLEDFQTELQAMKVL